MRVLRPAVCSVHRLHGEQHVQSVLVFLVLRRGERWRGIEWIVVAANTVVALEQTGLPPSNVLPKGAKLLEGAKPFVQGAILSIGV